MHQQPQKFVAYVRVSTQRQGVSGLGLDAQRAAIDSYVRDRGELVATIVEVESGKGSATRPELARALALCKTKRATLVIGKLDRLARNVHFVSGLIESGVDFIAADMPHANKVMIQMHAVMSEWERDQISERTRAALAAAKARGVKLGTTGPANLKRNIEERRSAADAFARRLSGLVEGFRVRGLPQRAMVVELNTAGVKTPNGGAWGLVQVQRLLARLPA